ncbi:hypothetical protein F5879DRAFT_346507 [Lentinula edodes]|nr:hypothetical protein F5879DRAFT_346507 [Lentinula edodes]
MNTRQLLRLCVLSCAIFTFFAQPASSFDLTFAGPTILGQNVSVVWNRNSTDSTAWFLQEISVNNTDPSPPIFISAPAEPQGVQTVLMPSKGPAGSLRLRVMAMSPETTIFATDFFVSSSSGFQTYHCNIQWRHYHTALDIHRNRNRIQKRGRVLFSEPFPVRF